MTVLIVADLHLDLWLDEGRDPLTALAPQDWAGLEALIVAGDLTNKPKVRWKYAIRHLARHIDPGRLHILPGNHDYYDHVLDGDDRLAAIAAEEGAQFVQKTALVIGTTRYLCCTLWTDFELHGAPAEAQQRARATMNDYRFIRNAATGFQKIRPYETVLIHHDHRAWLEGQLAQPFAGRTIVVTHHAPHPDLISAQRSDLDPVYGSNLTGMITHFQPDGWMFGHTHLRVEGQAGRTVIRNVSLGYPMQVGIAEEGAILRRGLIGVEGSVKLSPNLTNSRPT